MRGSHHAPSGALSSVCDSMGRRIFVRCSSRYSRTDDSSMSCLRERAYLTFWAQCRPATEALLTRLREHDGSRRVTVERPTTDVAPRIFVAFVSRPCDAQALARLVRQAVSSEIEPVEKLNALLKNDERFR